MVDIVLYPVKFLLYFFLNVCKLSLGIHPYPHPSLAHSDMCFGDVDPDLFRGQNALKGIHSHKLIP